MFWINIFIYLITVAYCVMTTQLNQNIYILIHLIILYDTIKLEFFVCKINTISVKMNAITFENYQSACSFPPQECIILKLSRAVVKKCLLLFSKRIAINWVVFTVWAFGPNKLWQSVPCSWCIFHLRTEKNTQKWTVMYSTFIHIMSKPRL